MRVPVFLDGLAIDCCVGVPEVGAAVSWPLAWSGEPGHAASFEIRWSTEAVRLDSDDAVGAGVPSGHRLYRGPLSAWWRGADERQLPRRGLLSVEPHGEVPSVVPDTRGRPLELSLLVVTVREEGHGRWRTVTEQAWPMADATGWGDWEDYAALGGRLARDEDRRPGGVVVMLDVSG